MSARRLSAPLGALLGLSRLLAVGLAAFALNDLASRRVGTGVEVAVLALTLRLLVSLAPALLREKRRREVHEEWFPRLARVFPPSPPMTSALESLALLPDDVEIDLARAGLATSLLGLIVVFLRSGWLGVLIVLGLMGISAPLYIRAGRAAEVMDVEYRVKHTRLVERELELLGAGLELRGLGVGHLAVEEVGSLSRAEHQVAETALRVALRSSLVTEFLSGVSVGLVAMVVGFALMGGRTSLVSALLSVLLTAEIFQYVRRYGLLFHRRERLVRARATLEPWCEEPEVATGEFLSALEVTTSASSSPVSLTLYSGDRVALLGASGAGKTTLCRTLLGWSAPLSGEVRRPRGPLGYVSVESRLPDGPLRELIGGDLPRAELRALLDSLGLHGERFADLDRPLVSDGEGLSTGERVRVLLARALARRSVLVILDDVAGVLDESTRARVEETLRDSPAAVLEASVDEARLITPRREIRL